MEKPISYVWPLIGRLVLIALFIVIFEKVTGGPGLSTEAVLTLAIGLTILDRQQAWKE